MRAALDLHGLGKRPSPGRHRASKGPSVLTLPRVLRGARTGTSGGAVFGLLAVLVCAGVVFGVRVAWAQRAAQPQPVGASQHATTGPAGAAPVVARSLQSAVGSGSTPAATSASGTGAGQPRTVTVHAVGQVATPGVVRLAEGSRVVDVLALAGGALPSADLQHLNLARVVTDGEQVYVPKPGEPVPVPAGPSGGGAARPAVGAPPGSSPGASSGGLVNLNIADAAALDGLPGVGPVLAQRILDWRAAHGRFSSVDELGEVTGIGEKMLADLASRVRV